MSWPTAEYNTTMTRTTTELLGSLKSGSQGGEGAWNELLKRYRPVVMKFARHLGLSEADAEDAAQQTLMELRSLYLAGRYDRAKGRLRSWLYGIARNQIRNSRKPRKHAEIQPADSAETTGFFDRIEDADHWEAMWADEWRQALVARCFEEIRGRLSIRDVEILGQLLLQEWTVAQVCEVQGVTPNVVHIIKHRAMKLIREIMPRMEEFLE